MLKQNGDDPRSPRSAQQPDDGDRADRAVRQNTDPIAVHGSTPHDRKGK